MFPVICNAAFFERTQNQFLQLELWQKQPDNAERMIGTTNLPLHQFYVAFRDPKVMQHLSRVKVCGTVSLISIKIANANGVLPTATGDLY